MNNKYVNAIEKSHYNKISSENKYIDKSSINCKYNIMDTSLYKT